LPDGPPVLTATHHSYGSLARLSHFFPHSPRGQNPQTIFTQNGSIDVDSRKDVPFAVKVATFYPRDAMLARVIGTAMCPSVRLSVCPSVTRRIVSKRRKLVA